MTSNETFTLFMSLLSLIAGYVFGYNDPANKEAREKIKKQNTNV